MIKKLLKHLLFWLIVWAVIFIPALFIPYCPEVMLVYFIITPAVTFAVCAYFEKLCER